MLPGTSARDCRPGGSRAERPGRTSRNGKEAYPPALPSPLNAQRHKRRR